MARPVHCPNRACTAAFPPESLRGVTRFTCPRCGKTFQLRPPPASAARRGGPAGRSVAGRAGGPDAPPPDGPDGISVELVGGLPEALPERDTPEPRKKPLVPPKSAAKVVPPTPAPLPVAIPEPVAAPPEPEPSPLAFEPQPEGGPIVALRPIRRRGGVWRTAVVLLLVGGMAGGGAWWYWRLYTAPAADRAEPVAVRTESGYVFPAPGRGWMKDPDLQLRMQVNTAYRRSQPAAAAALFTHDYKTRLPGESERIDEALAKLRNLFRRVEWERSPGEPRLGGEPTLAVDFDATDADEVDVRGTVYLLGWRGCGCWLFLWSPAGSREPAAPELERVRASFALRPEFREGWQEKPPDAATLAVPEAGVALSYAKGAWEEDDPAAHDPKAVRALKGTFPADGTGKQRDRHAGKVALVRALVLEAADLKTGAEAARTYVLEAQKDPERGNYPKTTLAPIKDKSGIDQDHETEFGPLHGRLTKLRMANTEDRERFVVLGVVARPEGRLLVLWCECDWSLRDYWDNEFGALLNSLRPIREVSKGGEKEKKAEPGD